MRRGRRWDRVRGRERGGGIRMREGVRRVGYVDGENRRESRYGR